MTSEAHIEELVGREFSSETTYMNTASLGLPPRRALLALHEAIESWRTGRSNPADFDAPLNEARTLYAALVHTEPGRVAVGSQVSAFVGLVASSLPDNSRVLTLGGEFTSVTFPFFAQAGRGIHVEEVAPEHLLDRMSAPGISLVAVSAVQSSSGQVIDLDALATESSRSNVPVLLDTTQAVGWLPVDASRFCYTVCGGYKWLLAPRGTCFFTVAAGRESELVPHSAGWYAGSQPWDSIYGSPLRLASDARKFDLSPAWHSWVAQAPALTLLTELGAEALNAHAVGLANEFCSLVGQPHQDSAIVSMAASSEVPERMVRDGLAASFRAGRLRLSFHVNNLTADVDKAAESLNGYVGDAFAG